MVSHVFPLVHHFLTPSTLWKEMKIVEKEGNLPGFDTDILNQGSATFWRKQARQLCSVLEEGHDIKSIINVCVCVYVYISIYPSIHTPMSLSLSQFCLLIPFQ